MKKVIFILLVVLLIFITTFSLYYSIKSKNEIHQYQRNTSELEEKLLNYSEQLDQSKTKVELLENENSTLNNTASTLLETKNNLQEEMEILISEKDGLQIKVDSLTKLNHEQFIMLTKANRETRIYKEIASCTDISSRPIMDYKSNSTASNSLKDWIGDFRGDVKSVEWDVLWGDSKAALHSIITGEGEDRVKDVFIVYFEDFLGPAVYWANQTCFLEIQE